MSGLAQHLTGSVLPTKDTCVMTRATGQRTEEQGKRVLGVNSSAIGLVLPRCGKLGGDIH